MPPSLMRRAVVLLPVCALLVLVVTDSALPSSKALIEDARDNGRVDHCYIRADFRDARRFATTNERMYQVLIDILDEAVITQVRIKGVPCGRERGAPGLAIAVASGGSAGLWVIVASIVTLSALGAGGWAHLVNKRAGTER